MPHRYRRDVKCTIEDSAQTRPYIGYCETVHKVVKMRTFNRRMITWKNIHETDTPIVRQFCEEFNLNPSCWFDPLTFEKNPDQDEVPNFLMCSFDIECYSETGEFPDANKTTDCVTMICLSFQRLKGGSITSHVLSLDAQPHVTTDAIVEKCDTEEALLQQFAVLVQKYNPDILTGYNIDNFDMRYMHTRLTDKEIFYQTLSRCDMAAKFSDSTYSYVQKGTYTTGRFLIPGRTTIDLLPRVKDYNATLKYDRKLENFKLDTVCKQELGATKTGFSVQEIFRAHETKCPVANQLLVEYNVQDCILVLDLQTKLQMILQLLQLSQISWTCLDDVIHRGQTCRVTNIVSKYAHQDGYYINTAKRKRGRDEDKIESFQGAHCFEPVVGIHTKMILGLDFASLYPSAIRRYNIDPSTLVLSPTKHPTIKRTLTDGKEEYAEFVVGTKQAPIPRLLEELGKARSTVKKQMKTAQGIEYDVLNQRQLAVKVTMNSVYGFLGPSTGPIQHPELAASVTAFGRGLVRQTADYVLETYPGAVIVGGDTDSVYATLPIEKTLEANFAEGYKIAEAIGDLFGYPIVLEMEKVYTPMLYLKKKMYAAVMYEHSTGKGKLDIKGIALARGDSSSLTKQLQLKTIEIIMKNPDSAWEPVKKLIVDAIQSIKEQDRKTLVKSKKLGDNYKFPDRQVQACVVERMKSRRQDAPQVGERVYYLVGKGVGGVCQRADNPENVSDIDYDYYVESQILKPMKGILDVLHKNWKTLIQDPLV